MSHSVDDPKNFGRVNVLMGGSSAERKISLASGCAVLESLRRQGVDAEAVDPADRWMTVLCRHRPDRVFIMLHGRGGEDGTIQGALDLLGVPYTGSGISGSVLAMDKMRCKWIWQGCGLPTPRFVKLKQDSEHGRIAAEIGLPLVVKPANEGSSLGMTIVNTVDEMAAAWSDARSYDENVIAEQWINGREYTVAILGEQALPLVRIETPRRFYDYIAKYDADDTRYYCPSGLDHTREQSLQAIARSAFYAIGAQGWGRVDIICDVEERPWLIEVNTVPGMTDHSLVPKAAQAANISFDTLVWRILETSM